MRLCRFSSSVRWKWEKRFCATGIFVAGILIGYYRWNPNYPMHFDARKYLIESHRCEEPNSFFVPIKKFLFDLLKRAPKDQLQFDLIFHGDIDAKRIHDAEISEDPSGRSRNQWVILKSVSGAPNSSSGPSSLSNSSLLPTKSSPSNTTQTINWSTVLLLKSLVSQSSQKNSIPFIEIPEDKEEILRYGHPGTGNLLRIFEGFATSYDFRTRNACWSCEHLSSAQRLNSQGPVSTRVNSQFKEDPMIPSMFQSKLSDFRTSGFDRGHLVPAADLQFHSQKAMDDSFFLTNISAQVPELNRQYWARLEQLVRNLTKHFSDVYVCTGPLFLPSQQPDGKWYVKYQVIGSPPLLPVPTHFYKVILAVRSVIDIPGHSSPVPISTNPLESKEFAIGAFVVPNTFIPPEIPLERFLVPLEAVETFSGLQFFSKVPHNRIISLCSRTKCVLPREKFWEPLHNRTTKQSSSSSLSHSHSLPMLPPPSPSSSSSSSISSTTSTSHTTAITISPSHSPTNASLESSMKETDSSLSGHVSDENVIESFEEEEERNE